MRKTLFLLAVTSLAPLALQAQAPTARATQAPIAGALAALGSPPDPKVAVAWDRFYDHAGIVEIARRLGAAHPGRIKVGSIGKSTLGRDMVLLTVTNFAVGDADRKPAMWIDGNIHSNEIQGAEFSLYTAWYLAAARRIACRRSTRCSTSTRSTSCRRSTPTRATTSCTSRTRRARPAPGSPRATATATGGWTRTTSTT